MKNLNLIIEDGLFLEIDKRTTPDFDHSDVVQKLLKKALALPQSFISLNTKTELPPEPTKNSIMTLIQSSEYRVLSGIDKYLAVMGWIHKHKRNEFEKIENYRKGNRVYFGKNQRQVEESGQNISAKQIPGSSWWTLATLDNRAKRKLLADVLELCNFASHERQVIVDSLPDSNRHRRINTDLGY